VVTLATKVEHGTTHPERYARTQCVVQGPEDLPGVRAEHKVRTAAHVAGS
jgi:hypothetical protein